ncbi:MAG: glucose 1-dehydrogenase [Pseudomonadota bacterium]|mgnify:FL=1|jgi:2-deoxy-D-gluconate 3-dehydrogenase|nr:glucose 1-dehydrogenase [Gammaproteobacteria bacterium]MEC8960701.1 glucose 1-dehydrogenase [Pseudomonadota bacterium]MEE3282795.1 glucose 1-dehydrogenase [Pseudomonadota bacterium]MEE3292816.1 glucose 1-dehydrogenase [Pseudomonadota bacterium]|tara:strand:+ start:150 stop:914 length:765 start_codon:yes stop_codon:yes gene_type:complete
MNSFNLSGRVAVVTGGNGGIGLAMAEGLASAGADIVIAARDSKKGAKALTILQGFDVRSTFIQVDVRDPRSISDLVESVVQELGGLHILVNNAGTNDRKQPEEYALEEWQTIIDTNLTSAFVASQKVYPHMSRAGGGKIINIGSMMSIFGASFTVPYASSKGGIVQMTKGMACAWAKDNVQVNAVLPGWIDTTLTREARQQVEGLHDRVEARTPAGRWGVPGDLSGIGVFLASSASDFVTGTAIPVDGGYSVQG